MDTSPIVSVDGGEDGRSRPRTAGSPPSGGELNRQYRNSSRARTRGRRAAFTVAGFLAAFLPLNTYWAVGGTWGIAWVLGCAGCTLPLALVRVQEAMVMAGIAVVLARAGLWRAPLPGWIWRLGLWTMAAAFGAVGAQNLLGDNTPQARFLFAPLALSLCVLSAVANRLLPAASAGTATEDAGARP